MLKNIKNHIWLKKRLLILINDDKNDHICTYFFFEINSWILKIKKLKQNIFFFYNDHPNPTASEFRRESSVWFKGCVNATFHNKMWASLLWLVNSLPRALEMRHSYYSNSTRTCVRLDNIKLLTPASKQ